MSGGSHRVCTSPPPPATPHHDKAPEEARCGLVSVLKGPECELGSRAAEETGVSHQWARLEDGPGLCDPREQGFRSEYGGMLCRSEYGGTL